jgi:hypothetical protein
LLAIFRPRVQKGRRLLHCSLTGTGDPASFRRV